jgi:hypothetical protein
MLPLEGRHSMLKCGQFRKQIRNTWKVLKFGAGEGWRGSVEMMV